MLPMEKRLHPRVCCEIEASFKNMNQPSTPVVASAAICDISEGGVRFRVNHFLPVHNRLRMHLNLPKSEAIETIMELAWIREIPFSDSFEAGAHFVDFPFLLKRPLQHYIFQQLLAHS